MRKVTALLVIVLLIAGSGIIKIVSKIVGKFNGKLFDAGKDADYI